MARRKTTNVNGHRRRKQRGQVQYSTVEQMEQAKADKCRAGYDALAVKPHQWKAAYHNRPDPLAEVLQRLIRECEAFIANAR